jgi:hypothetical protein
MDNARIARLGQNTDRKGYFVEFRHPKRLDGRGKFGKKIRRGVGVDRGGAEAVLHDLQAILNDEYWWSFERKTEAEAKFPERLAVTIFYEGMEPTPPDYIGTRDKIIRLPDRHGPKPHAYILPLGPAGAGKSTVDRHLLGTDPERHRFPATATVKTTTYETEIIIEDGEYEAVATFLPRDQVRDLIEDCVLAAARARIESSDAHEPVRKLLEHTEERFRLRYILGDFPAKKDGEPAGEFDDPVSDVEDDGSVLDEERKRWADQLAGHISAIDSLATETWSKMPKVREASLEAEREQWDNAMEAFEDALRNDDRLLDIVDGIEHDIEKRFAPYLEQMQCTRDRWPVLWHFKHIGRDEFISALKTFTSVSSVRWGKLLTPVVSGLRIRGPFRPEWYDGKSLPRWVILDTEGLGHDPATATAVPTSITSKYEMVDAILLVDSAKQAMTHAATSAALRNIAASGHAAKLMICFTHFDLMDANNLRTVDARKDRLLTSVDNVIANIGKSPAGRTAELALRRALPKRVFFLGHLDKRLDCKSDASKTGVGRLAISEFRRLSQTLDEQLQPKPKPVIHPVYHGKHLGFAVQGAAQDFHQRWLALLGFESHSIYHKAKWQTVKALTRRLAERWADQFGGLMPVADLIECLQERLQAFLSHPIGWVGDDKKNVPREEVTEEAKEKAIESVVTTVHARLHAIAPQRLLAARLSEWAAAYGHSGAGSTVVRARDMRSIYEHAVPIPSDTASEDAMRFLDDVAELVEKVIDENGGLMV